MKPRILVFLIGIVSLVLSACQPASAGNISFMVFGDPAELSAYQKLIGIRSNKRILIFKWS